MLYTDDVIKNKKTPKPSSKIATPYTKQELGDQLMFSDIELDLYRLSYLSLSLRYCSSKAYKLEMKNKKDFHIALHENDKNNEYISEKMENNFNEKYKNIKPGDLAYRNYRKNAEIQYKIKLKEDTLKLFNDKLKYFLKYYSNRISGTLLLLDNKNLLDIGNILEVLTSLDNKFRELYINSMYMEISAKFIDLEAKLQDKNKHLEKEINNNLRNENLQNLKTLKNFKLKNNDFHLSYINKDDTFKNILNQQMKKNVNEKHILDRINYYGVINDNQIFNIFIVPVLAFHVTLFHIALPPISTGIAATTASIGILSLLDGAKAVAKEGTKLSYNVLKNDKCVIIKEENEKKDLEQVSTNNLKEMQKSLSNLKETAKRTGQFNFFFANAFNYYFDLRNKNNLDYEALSVNSVKKNLDELRKTYHTTLYYSKFSRILLDTLKIQMDSMKIALEKSQIIMRSIPNLSEFFKSNIDPNLKDNRYYNYRNIIKGYLISQFKTSSSKDLKNLDLFTEFILSTMNEKNLNFNKLTQQKIDELNNIETNVAKALLYFKNFQSGPDSIRRGLGIISGIPDKKIDDALKWFGTDYKYAVNAGAWVLSSAIKGILFVSDKDMHKKYETLEKYAGYAADTLYTLQYAGGLVKHIGDWSGLFATSGWLFGITNTPFSLIVDIGITELSREISNNEIANWKEICIKLNNKIINNRKKNVQEQESNIVYNYIKTELRELPIVSMKKIQKNACIT